MNRLSLASSSRVRAGAVWVAFAMTALTLSGCERHHPPAPSPVAAVDAGPSPVIQSGVEVPRPATVAATLPYGASAPIAPGSDGVPASATAVTPRVALAPERQIDLAPTGAGPAASAVPLTSTELNFLTQAMEAVVFHIRASQLALDRANDSAVKSYAALLVADQPKVSSSLQALARQMGLPLPETLSEPKQRVLDKLARTAQSDFDKEYLASAGIDDQHEVIALFEKTWRETRDPGLRSFVMATLPTLQAHLSAAERLPLHG
ncbi:MAG: DUF4142 domain-containing protein [Acidobacteriota bacterium]